MQFTDKRIVISGSKIEVYKYDGAKHAYDFSLPKRYKPEVIIPDNETEQEKAFRLNSEALRKVDSRRRSMLRAKSYLVRLVESNIWRFTKDDGKPYIPIFLTLTFADDIKDIPTANYIFSKFIKRLNYEVIGEKKGFLKYVGVTEFQDKNRGVIHFHLVFFNLKFIWADTMAGIWGEGYIKIKKLGRVKNIASYITKYMSKNFEDTRMDGKKRYFSSNGLFKPLTFLDQTWVNQIYGVLPKKHIVSEREYDSRYEGVVKKQDYRLPRTTDIEDIVRKIYE